MLFYLVLLINIDNLTNSQHIAGLGDRHLENLLVDMTTGAVIQIDFGICFGMGSSVLAVPELMPFRLTPQLRAVLQPLDGVGLLRHYMIQCLQALREDATSGSNGSSGGSGEMVHSPSSSTSVGNASSKGAAGKVKTGGAAGKGTAITTEDALPPQSYSGIIPNALEVYLNDPVVDWLKGAATAAEKAKTTAAVKPTAKAAANTSTAHSSNASSSAADSADAAAAESMREEWAERRQDIKWEPRRRVHLAVQKLIGADPVSVLLLDLGMNQWVRKENTLPALTKIITASAEGKGSAGSGSGETGSGSSSASSGSISDGMQTLSVGRQVDKLINIATDPDVLVRQWCGLQTWL